MEYEPQFWVRNKVPTGFPPMSSRRTAYKPPPRFSDEVTEEIKGLKASGFTLRQLASKFCCSTTAISTALKKKA